MHRLTLWAGVLLLVLSGLARAADYGEPSRSSMTPPLVRAEMRAERSIIQSGRPVWVEFTLSNLTSDSLTLRTPASSPDQPPSDEMGLPVSHVFSGPNYSAIFIKDSRNETLDSQVSVKPRSPVPTVRLAPYASIGVRLDLTQYYDSMLHRPGKYTLVWRPYDGTVESPPLNITLLAERQAVILTKFGKMTMRFYFDEAPNTVQNFIDLVEQRPGFYDNLTFHRIVPGGIIQGGDPLGDGRGTRADGKRLQAEFSKIPFELGTVGMARSPRDPHSASCQFFICLGRQPSFDGQQTAFGYLVGDESFETLKQIAAVPTGPRDRPQKPVYIQTISLENVPAREREVTASGNAASRPAANPIGRGGSEGGPGARKPVTPLGSAVTRKPLSASRPEAELEQ